MKDTSHSPYTCVRMIVLNRLNVSHVKFFFSFVTFTCGKWNGHYNCCCCLLVLGYIADEDKTRERERRKKSTDKQAKWFLD